MTASITFTVAGVIVAAGIVIRRLLLAGIRSTVAARLGPAGAGANTRRRPPAWFSRQLEAAAVAGDPADWWRRWTLTGAALSATAAVAGGPGAGLVAAATAVSAVPATLHGLRHRGDQELERHLPGLLDVTAAALRSGASLPQALGAAATRPGRLADDLRRLVAAVERGAPLVAELDRWAERRPLPSLRLAAAALALGADSGGARARAVDGVAQTLRDRLALRREVSAQAAQARASAAVMTVVPLVIALLAAMSDPRTAAFLFRSWPGLVCILAGLALDGAAGLWMLRLIRGAS